MFCPNKEQYLTFIYNREIYYTSEKFDSMEVNSKLYFSSA